MPPQFRFHTDSNCVVHLHSAANLHSFFRQSSTFKNVAGPHGEPLLAVTFRNEQRLFTPVDIITLILMFKVKISTHNINNIIVVLPPYLNNAHRRSNFSAAAVAAGITVFEFIDRPAMAAYAYDMFRPGTRNILVVDHESGVLDVSFLAFSDGGYEIRANVNRERDFGCPLVDHLIAKLRRRAGVDLSGCIEPYYRLQYACERTKKALCSGDVDPAVVQVDSLVEGIDLYESISLSGLVEMNLALVRGMIGKCLMDAGAVGPDGVEEVVLAGVSSDIEQVRRVIEECFQGNPLRASVDPAVVVKLSTNHRAEQLTSVLKTHVGCVVIRLSF